MRWYQYEAAGCLRPNHCSPGMSTYDTVRRLLQSGTTCLAAPCSRSKAHHMLFSQITAVDTAHPAMSSPLQPIVNNCRC